MCCEESGLMQADNTIVIVSRLRSAAGHLRAVTRMVENGAPCGEVLHQLNAVQGALRAVARELLAEHLVESERIIKDSDCPIERALAVDHLMEIYNWAICHK